MKRILIALLIISSLSFISCGDKNNSIYKRKNDKVYFGKYPQSRVEANNKNGLLSYEFDDTWVSYNYYLDGLTEDYMYYKDIDKDNDGDYDYRGVYFDKYREYSCFSLDIEDYTYQDNNGYYTNNIYWFKYEPIEWNILKEENGNALIIANLILDSQDYYPSARDSKFEHNDGDGYANNYELSNIRKWLNDTFYNIAFSDKEKEIINITEVDNSPKTTLDNYNKYACDNTSDKIYLLSYEEAMDFYSNSEKKQAKGTAYAKSQGLWVSNYRGSVGCSYYWLRSPYMDDPTCTFFVTYNGSIYEGIFNKYYVYYTQYGVRPVLNIKL